MTLGRRGGVCTGLTLGGERPRTPHAPRPGKRVPLVFTVSSQGFECEVS